MPSYHWAKLWIDVLDDHKLGPLDDHLWRRFFEFILLAKEEDDNGWLPTARAIAWRLRTTEAEIVADLEALAQVCDGTLVEQQGDRWHIVNFVKRQETPMDAAERKARQRDRDRRLGDDDATEDVTEDDTPASQDCHDTVTERDTDKRREEKRRGRVREGEETRTGAAPSPVPNTPDNGSSRARSTDRSTSYSAFDPSVIPKDTDLERVWPIFLDEMKLQMTQATYDQWMARVRPLGVMDGAAILGCEDRYVFEWCAERLSGPIGRTLRGVLHKALDVRYLNMEGRQ